MNRNLKTDYQILMIFGKNLPDTTGHEMTTDFPLHLTYVSAQPGKTVKHSW